MKRVEIRHALDSSNNGKRSFGTHAKASCRGLERHQCQQLWRLRLALTHTLHKNTRVASPDANNICGARHLLGHKLLLPQLCHKECQHSKLPTLPSMLRSAREQLLHLLANHPRHLHAPWQEG